MGQDLKKLFENDRLVNHTRKSDHEDVFIERLYTELPMKKKSSFGVLKIAASIVLFLTLGITTYLIVNQDKNLTNPEFILSDISPDLKEIESFYVASIDQVLSEIQQKNSNRAVVNRYMNRLSILKEEHQLLVVEMKEEGPNTMSINALINNLKMQLELLQGLKSEVETVKNNQNEIS